MSRAKITLGKEPSPIAQPAAAIPDDKTPAHRRGTKLIAGHFPKATWVELRFLATNQERSAQELIGEALTDLFAKYRRKS